MNTEPCGCAPACADSDMAKDRAPACTRAEAIRRGVAGLALGVACLSSWAQVLSSPIAGAPAPAGSPGIGSGPGYFDPRSSFKPLAPRADVVPWSVLSSVTTRPGKGRIVPTFPDPVRELDQKVVKVQGFMMPLEPGEKQRHFLLSSVPTTCAFCVPAGPEGLVEVRSKTPVRYTLEPVVVEGRLAVLSDDPYGMFYRVTDAQPTP